MKTILRSLSRAALIAALLSPAVRADSVSNDALLPLDATVVGPAGEPLTVSGAVAVGAEVGVSPDGAAVTATCAAGPGGSQPAGAAALVPAAPRVQQTTMLAPLPADMVLLCPAQIVRQADGALQQLRVVVNATVFEDGRVAFALGEVAVE